MFCRYDWDTIQTAVGGGVRGKYRCGEMTVARWGVGYGFFGLL